MKSSKPGDQMMKSGNGYALFVKVILPRIAVAALFGVAAWMALESVQPLLMTPLYGYEDCCERCKNILYDRAQPLLAACAAIAFLWVSFLNVKGWKGTAKAILACWLSFQIYSALTAWSVISRQECTALYVIRSIPIISLVLLGFQMFFEGLWWTGVCALPILTVYKIRAKVFANGDEFQSLDLDRQ